MAKCEHCGRDWKNLFQITHDGKTKIVCLVCKNELSEYDSLGKTEEVKTKPPTDKGSIQW